MKTKLERRVEYARRHAEGIVDTHSAIFALSRIEDIIDQTESILSETEPSIASEHVRITLVDYYVVALCTALEWHARTRLVDMFVARPDSMEQSDIDNFIKVTDAVSLIRDNVSIAHLVGAGINISSSDAYFLAFKRIFANIGIKDDARKICVKYTVKDKRDQFSEMFTIRNSFVHEIRMSEIGPFYIRGIFSVAGIHDLAVMCKNVFIEIEKKIAVSAPDNFPNRLDANLNPVDNMDLIYREYEKIEAEALSMFDGDEMADALRLSAEALSKEIRTIEQSEAFNIIRFADFRTPLIRRLIDGRMAYLKAIIATVRDG